MKLSVLAMQSDTAGHAPLRACLPAAAVELHVTRTCAAARAGLAGRGVDVALLDVDTEENLAGLIADILAQGGARGVVLCGRPDATDQIVAGMRAGAADFVASPLTGATLLPVLRRAAGLGEAGENTLRGWRARHAPGFVGEDPRTLELLELVRRVAATRCDVLVTGASGTGKELVARSIHAASPRARQPFVALNCAAIPRDLIESEIFGHARGAFTGATERRGGKFEAAAGGTLFLDEVGEMDLALQAKFLRVVQEREVTPVGDNRCIKVDVRIISATNQDLPALCQARLFREDLYYRLNVVELSLPPLAERPGDIPALVHHFLARANGRHGRHVRGVETEAMAQLCRYSWPGNVRELANLIERLVVLKAAEGAISAEELPLARSVSAQVAVPHPAEVALPEHGLDINAVLAELETRLTQDALRRAGGNRARAAELLGLKRTTLVERLKKLNIVEPAITAKACSTASSSML